MAKSSTSKPKQKNTLFSNVKGIVWYGQVLIFLPIILVVSGGLVGGLCGGLAIYFNIKIWKSTLSTPVKILLSLAALVGGFMVSVLLAALILGAL